MILHYKLNNLFNTLSKTKIKLFSRIKFLMVYQLLMVRIFFLKIRFDI